MSSGGTWLGGVAGQARAHPRLVDVATGAMFALFALVAVCVADQNPTVAAGSGYVLDGLAKGWRMFGTALSPTLPLMLRRRFPMTGAAAAIVGYFAAHPLFGVESPFVPLAAICFALYSATAYSDQRWRWWAVAGLFVLDMAGTLSGVELYMVPMNAPSGFAGLIVVVAVALFVFSVALGAAAATSRQQRRELADQAEQLRAEREENTRRAVVEERLRISRELHDVVAHHVSMMGVQAGAARRVMRRQPHQAQEALTAIETSSRQAVSELQQLLGFLRRDTDGVDHSESPSAIGGLFPQPRVAQLSDLVATSERATLEIHGPARELPRTVEVSIYRVVQEALTNTLKHCRGATVSVALSYLPSAVEVTVRDDGRGVSVPHGNRRVGHGLIGMRERVALHQGQLSAGPRPDGGFSIEASFPLESAQS